MSKNYITDLGILDKPDVQSLEMPLLSVCDRLFELLSKLYPFQVIRRICTGKFGGKKKEFEKFVMN